MEGLNGNGTLLSFRFRVTGDVSQADLVRLTELVLNEEVLVSAAAIGAAGVPRTYALEQNYPNPFNPETQFRFQVPETVPVLLAIYNLLGQQVRTLVDEVKSPGAYIARWDGRNAGGQGVASGGYIYRLTVGDRFTSTRKMTLLR